MARMPMTRGGYHGSFGKGRGFGAGFGPSPRGGMAKELATKSLFIQSKKFYVDVRENHRGKFVKISEVGVNGQKSRIFFDMAMATTFNTKLGEFCDCLSSLGPTKWDRTQMMVDEGKLKSDSIFCEDRRYYMDLKENHRGRFLKVSMALSTYDRSQIVIPAQGMISIREVLDDLLAEHGGQSSAAAVPKVQPAVMVPEREMAATIQNGKKDEAAERKTETSDTEDVIEYDGKKFAFAIGENPKGKYLRISEVSSNSRTAITVPQQSFQQFVEMVDQALAGKLVEDTKQDYMY